LNAHDILTYILSRYNVTVRVTTFEEPSLEAMELMASTDVLIGMHGAGWTNSLFIKRGAGALQLLPYGWLLDNGGVIRGAAFQSMLLASDCIYSEWGNLKKEHAFMRRHDFVKSPDISYALHPQSSWPLPTDKRPGNYWVYQNTFVDIVYIAPHIDALMGRMGIEAVD
jgi:Glycosyltransferase 61